MDVHLRYPPPPYTQHTQTNREQTHRAFIGNRGCEAQLKTAISHQFNPTNTHSQIIEKRQTLNDMNQNLIYVKFIA